MHATIQSSTWKDCHLTNEPGKGSTTPQETLPRQIRGHRKRSPVGPADQRSTGPGNCLPGNLGKVRGGENRKVATPADTKIQQNQIFLDWRSNPLEQFPNFSDKNCILKEKGSRKQKIKRVRGGSKAGKRVMAGWLEPLGGRGQTFLSYAPFPAHDSHPRPRQASSVTHTFGSCITLHRKRRKLPLKSKRHSSRNANMHFE